MSFNYTQNLSSRNQIKKSIAIILSNILLLLFSPTPENVQAYAASGFPEYQVKAELLFRLAELVDWPTSSDVASAPFVIAIFGKNPFDSYLRNRALSEKIHHRQVKIETFEEDLNEERIQILFICENDPSKVAKILQRFAGKPVLIVGNSHELAIIGAHIGLRIIEDRIGFSLNLESAQASHLKISPSILRLATQIIGDHP